MEAGFEFQPEMRQWISPSLIEANYILSLSQQELQAAIEQELLSNPALELEERSTCPACGTSLEGAWCPTCRADPSPSLEHMTSNDDENEWRVSSVVSEADDEFDPLSIVASRMDPREVILSDARILLEEQEHPIAAYLVNSFDERGFLNETLETLSGELGASTDQLWEVLEVLQDVAPVGVGARSLAECLHLQTDFLRRSGEEIPEHVSYLIDHHLDDLGAHKFGKLARQLGVTPDDIEAARDFIRDRLNPHPMQSTQARSWGTPTDSPLVSPDVIVRIDNDDILVEIVDSRYNYLRMNGVYNDLLARISRQPKDKPVVEVPAEPIPVGEDVGLDDDLASDAAAAMDTEERDHIRQFSSRARLFISNIEQRRETLLKISKVVCEFQEEFLRGGVRNLKPLTRAVVAQQVGVHESTVSRATANKFVMLPSHKVIPYSDFFRPSLSTKDVIKEIIENEEANGTNITDREICDRLLDEGIRIARRTVAKYRSELGILPSTMR
jgi:RNA polymerase sigma-54 factor